MDTKGKSRTPAAPVDEVINAILENAFYLSRDEFTSTELAASTTYSESQMRRACEELNRRGGLEKIQKVTKTRGGRSLKIKWRQKTTWLNRISWRMGLSNSEIGLREKRLGLY